MATQLSIVNQVLRRLREDQVSATTDTAYAQLIASFVADIHQEVLEAHTWNRLITEYSVTVTTGTTDYNISGPTENSFLLYDSNEMPLAFLLRNSSDTQPYQMIQETYNDRYADNREWASATSQENPITFAIVKAGTGWRLTLRDVPSSGANTKLIKMLWWTPEAELLADGTTDSVSITIPTRPIFLGALFLALNERGEEIGEPGGVAERRYINALSAAREVEISNESRLDAYNWFRN